jgi:hypothetical protein
MRTGLIVAWLLWASIVGSGTATADRAAPGCDPGRPAVAHRSGGRVIRVTSPRGPIACGVTTGYGGSETRIAVTRSGAVVYAAAVITPGAAGLGYLPGAPGPHPQTPPSPAGLAISYDDGGTWKFVKPMGETWQPSDHQLFVDHDTGRLFWSEFGPNPFPQGGDVALVDQTQGTMAHLLMSPDDGRTWTDVKAPCCPLFSENPRFAAAKPPARAPKPVNYPNVVYYCGNTNVGGVSPIIAGRVCSRSLDGGVTWEMASILFTSSVPQHTECNGRGEEFSAIDGNYPQAAPDGSLYVMVKCDGHAYLARSRDEAATWPILHSKDGTPLEIPEADEMRIDTAGNFYLLRAAGGRVFMRTSRDRGRHWGRELDMTAPKAQLSSLEAVPGEGDAVWFVAVRERGHVAVSYYGQRSGQGSSDAYITESRNALSPSPTFWSATLNDPRSPVLTSTQGSRTPGPAYIDFNGVDIGPDGNPWGSFVADCPDQATDPACSDASGRKTFAARGFAGRLLWPSS